MLNLNSAEPECFTSFKHKNNPHSYSDDCNDYNLRKCLRESLLIEQKHQCFYCEKKIENDTDKVHIDHIKKRDVYHDLECTYSNMALSCNGSGEKHCGKFKDKHGEWDDTKYLKLLPDNSELKEQPSDVFRYISNGEIKPIRTLEDNLRERTQNTIDYLCLNHSDLVNARKVIFTSVASCSNGGMCIEDILITFNEFESLLKDY